MKGLKEKDKRFKCMKMITLLGIMVAVLCSCSNDDDEKPQADPALVYFLVTETDVEHGDSYILPLKDAEAIAEARAIIANNEKKIILAEISNDPNEKYSLNKDLLKNRTWSWHIVSFNGFVDTSIEILDGWPAYVEDNYSEWVENTKGDGTNGNIGFWNYTLEREVPADELY
jgi:hypothetical protein